MNVLNKVMEADVTSRDEELAARWPNVAADKRQTTDELHTVFSTILKQAGVEVSAHGTYARPIKRALNGLVMIAVARIPANTPR